MKWRNRPKWAKPLNARLWKHLCESSENGRPTLAGFKRCRAFQKEQGITCWDCEAAAKRIGIE